MNRVYVLILFIFSLFLFTANFNHVLASRATITLKKAVEQGWMKLYIPFGESNPVSACTIRQPSDTELSSLIEYCKANEKVDGMTISSPNDCENYIRSVTKGLCVQSRDAASYLKLTYVPRITYAPTPTLTVTPTPTLTPTPTPVNITNYKIAKTLYFNKKIGDMTFNELVGMIKQLMISLIPFKK